MGEANFYYFTCLKFFCKFSKQSRSRKMSSVKDVDQQKFVVGFADFLKKSGKMMSPNGLISSSCPALTSRDPTTPTGSSLEPLPSPATCTSGPRQALDLSPRSTEPENATVPPPATS